MAERTCRDCGKPFSPKHGPGRPRVRCENCRPPEPRRASQPALSPPITRAGAPDHPGDRDGGEGPLAAAVRAALEAVGRASSPEGTLALQHAQVLEQGGHTASGAASLSRELRMTLKAALANAAGADADPVDELAQRRERRAQGTV